MHQFSWRHVLVAMAVVGIGPLVPRAAAAQTGKISGVVVDAGTGQPIEGVQIQVRGTGLGAQTQANGRYFIISVPPGSYTVVARRIGYQSTEVSNVEVRIDVTREVNFRLGSAVVGLQAVRVEAPPTPLVETGVTGSSAAITADVITALPVTNVAGVLALQQGFLEVPQNTDITSFTDTRRNVVSPIRIRGGRAGETLTLIDGIPINNVVFGGPAFDLNSMAVQQLNYQKGGFEPQYGNALSGIINIATREGGNELAGSLSYQTTGLGGSFGSTPDELRGFNLYQGYLSGPVPGTDSRLRFMFAGQTQSGRDRVLEFDRDVFTFSRDFTRNPNRLDLFSGWRGVGYDSEHDVIGKLTLHATPSSQINLAVIDYERQRQPFDMDFLLTGFDPLRFVNSAQDSLGVFGFGGYEDVVQNSIQAQRTLYMATLQQRFGRSNLRVRAARFDQSRQTCNFFQGICLGARFSDMNFTGDAFYNPGVSEGQPTQGTDEFFGGEEVKTNVLRADLESQVTDHHNLQAGLFWQGHDIRFREWRNQGTNNVLVVPQQYSAKPYEAAAYMQDRIEYDFLTVKLGFRFDYGRAAGSSFANPLDPTNGTTARQVCEGQAPSLGVTTPYTYTDTAGPGGADDIHYTGYTACAAQPKPQGATRSPLLEQATRVAQGDDFARAEARKAFSPRIGINFPLTERSGLFFNFGRYSQNPLYNNLYQNTGVGTLAGEEGGNVCREDQVRPNSTECYPIIFSDGYRTAFVGNTNLALEQTTSYEIGYAAEIGAAYATNITVFSKDQSGLSGIRQSSNQVFDVGSTYGTSTPRYTVIVNQDFSTTRGVEVQFRRRIRNFWGYDINYSFSKSTTNAPPPDRAEQSFDEGDPTQRNEITSEIDQPHVFNASIFLRVDDVAPSFRFGNLLRDSYLTTTVRAASGLPYTPILNFTGIGADNLLEVNTGRSPSTSSVDLLAGKDFRLANVRSGAFVRVQNLFDTKNCLQVYPTTGRCDAGTVNQNRVRSAGQAAGPGTTSTFFDRPAFFGERRAIYAGARVRF